MRSCRWLVLVALFGLALAGSSAAASDAQPLALRPPPGSPDPKLMVLQLSDLPPGASISSQGYSKDEDTPSEIISYEREFEGAQVGSAELITLSNTAEVFRSVGIARSLFATTKALLTSKAGRAQLKKAFEEGASEELGGEDIGLVSNVQIGKPRSLGVGEDSIHFLITARVLGIRTEIHFAFLRVRSLSSRMRRSLFEFSERPPLWLAC